MRSVSPDLTGIPRLEFALTDHDRSCGRTSYPDSMNLDKFAMAGKGLRDPLSYLEQLSWLLPEPSRPHIARYPKAAKNHEGATSTVGQSKSYGNGFWTALLAWHHVAQLYTS